VAESLYSSDFPALEEFLNFTSLIIRVAINAEPEATTMSEAGKNGVSEIVPLLTAIIFP
jgi:hypothetical protein